MVFRGVHAFPIDVFHCMSDGETWLRIGLSKQTYSSAEQDDDIGADEDPPQGDEEWRSDEEASQPDVIYVSSDSAVDVAAITVSDSDSS